MTDQLALYDWLDNHTPTRPRARASDPWTSHAAAASITPGSSEGRILDALRFGPLTDEELEDVLAGRTKRGTITTARSRLSKPDDRPGRERPPLVVSVGTKLNAGRRSVNVWGLAVDRG